MSSSMTMPTRFVGDTTDLALRRRYRRLPSDVQRALSTSGVICHARVRQVEGALIAFGPAATLAWIARGARS